MHLFCKMMPFSSFITRSWLWLRSEIGKFVNFMLYYFFLYISFEQLTDIYILTKNIKLSHMFQERDLAPLTL